MAKKNSVVYKCSSCGYSQSGWLGRCPQCGEWNTMEEFVVDSSSKASINGNIIQKIKPVSMKNVVIQENERIASGSTEFDRVLGGGATKRSAILIGGEPGIGKSTLLIQTAASFLKYGKVLYVSGEESASQIKSRAVRLNLNVDSMEILCTLRLEDILSALDSVNPLIVIVDSIQTVYSTEAGIIPGTISQLKYCSNELISWVKERDSVLFMTAHVTKDGNIAGPKSLEHMVDTVLSFERNTDEIRFLRSQKNRFGSVEELGIFTMESNGLHEIKDPSAMFITKRQGTIPAGISYVSVFEGSRVFVVEIQALTVDAKSSLNRVYSEKIDNSRVTRIAAVLEKQVGIIFSDQDIYVNVAGGIKISESAIDAAIACALYSARVGVPLPENCMITGELSLAGEIRPVTKLKQRIKTASEMGFTQFYVPEKTENCQCVTNIKDLIKALFR